MNLWSIQELQYCICNNNLYGSLSECLSVCILGVVPCRLSILILENVPVLSHSNQELVDTHGGIYSNFPACKSCKKQLVDYLACSQYQHHNSIKCKKCPTYDLVLCEI